MPTRDKTFHDANDALEPTSVPFYRVPQNAASVLSMLHFLFSCCHYASLSVQTSREYSNYLLSSSTNPIHLENEFCIAKNPVQEQLIAAEDDWSYFFNQNFRISIANTNAFIGESFAQSFKSFRIIHSSFIFEFFGKGMASICNMIAYQRKLFIKIVHFLNNSLNLLTEGVW